MPVFQMLVRQLILFFLCILAGEAICADNGVKSRIDLIDDARSRIEQRINRRHKFFETQLHQLDEINSQYQDFPNAALESSFKFSETVWQDLVNRSFSSISSQFLQSDLPKIDETDLDVARISPEEISLVSDYYSSFDLWLDAQLELDQNLYNRTLLLSGKVRSKLYQELKRRHLSPIEFFSQAYFQDLYWEIKIIPTRWAATLICKVYDWKRNISQGIGGAKLIASDIFYALLLLFSSVYLIRRFSHISDGIESWADQKIASFAQGRSKIVQLVLYLVNRAIPWLLIVLLVYGLMYVINLTTLNELSEPLSLVNYYVYYRLFLALITYGITRLKIEGIISFSYKFYKKFFKTTRRLALVFLIYFMLLQAVESVVGKAIFYQLIDSIFIGVITVAILYELWFWREEADALEDRLFPRTGMFSRFLVYLDRVPVLKPFIGIIFIILGLVIALVAQVFSGTAISNKISSLIFVHRVKRSGRFDSELQGQQSVYEQLAPKILAKQSVRSFLIETVEKLRVKRLIDRWVAGESDVRCVAVVGEAGSGRTTLLDDISDELPSAKIIHVRLTCKCLTLNDLVKQISLSAGFDAHTPGELVQIIETQLNSHKLVIIIDNAHHLFLSVLHGFDVLKKLCDFMDQHVKQIFWALSFERFSWAYLSRALEDFDVFQETIYIAPWSQADIRRLIQFRMQNSGVSISFDDLAVAFKVDAETDLLAIEDRYYQLLTQRSRGNPQRALTLCVRSLHRTLYSDEIMVGLPRTFSSDSFRALDENDAYVLAAIAKHGSLTKQQSAQVTNIGSGIVSRSIKQLLLLELLDEHSSGYYQPACEFFEDWYLYLKGQNLIYG